MATQKHEEQHMPHRKQTNLQANTQPDALPVFLRRKGQSRNSAEQSLLRDQMAGGSMLNCFQSLEAPK